MKRTFAGVPCARRYSVRPYQRNHDTPQADRCDEAGDLSEADWNRRGRHRHGPLEN